MDWMEPYDYQGMEVEEVKFCKGAHYQNLFWVREPKILKDCAIKFWIYWEVLQAVAMKVLQLFEEAAMKYQRIVQFAIGPHAIHVQAGRDWDK